MARVVPLGNQNPYFRWSTGGIDWVPWLWSEDSISSSTKSIHTGTVSTFSCTPYLSLEFRTGSKLSFYLQTVHPRGGSHLPLRCCFWVLAHAIAPWFRWIAWRPRDHLESQCKDWQNGRIIYLLSLHSSFRFLRLTQKNRATKNRVFWPFGWRSRTSEKQFSTPIKVDFDFRYV
jgi:hypothetical protein